jgi:hypothetical protein
VQGDGRYCRVTSVTIVYSASYRGEPFPYSSHSANNEGRRLLGRSVTVFEMIFAVDGGKWSSIGGGRAEDGIAAQLHLVDDRC